MGSSSQQQSSQSSSAPWGPQASALQGAFDNANTAYAKASTATAPTQFTAGMTPEQLQNFQSMVGYGANAAPVANGVANAGLNNLNTGSAATAGALNSLGAFNPSANNNIGTATQGGQQFANGLDINGAVKNAMLEGTQTARDVTLPGMESAAAGNGNINSSRTGLSEGLVQRGLAEQAAGLTANMTNNAYTTGAGISATQGAQNNQQLLQALAAQGSLGNTASATGAAAAGSGITDMGNLFTLAGMGGSGLQKGDQLGLTNQLQQYEANVSSPYDALNGLMGIIGSRSWGSNNSGTQNTTTNPSLLNTLFGSNNGGIVGGIGGILSGF